MSRNYADYQSGQSVYTEWQQQPTQIPGYVEWQQPYHSHAERHAARQPDFQQFGYHPYSQPHSYTDPYTQLSPAPPSTGWPPPPPQHSSCWSPTNHYHQAVYCRKQPTDLHQHHSYEHEHHQHYQPFNLPEPQPRHTPDLEPNLSVAALVSQLERLTADVEKLVSRMDANERHPTIGFPDRQPEYIMSEPYAAHDTAVPPQSFCAGYTNTQSEYQQPGPAAPTADQFSLQALPTHHSIAVPPQIPKSNFRARASDSAGLLCTDEEMGMLSLNAVDCPRTVSDLSFLLSMGYRENEAKRALRRNNSDVGCALDFIVEEKAKRTQKRKEALKRQKEIISRKRKRLCEATLECVERLSNGAAFAPKRRPCSFDPGGDSSPKLRFATLFIVSWFPP